MNSLGIITKYNKGRGLDVNLRDIKKLYISPLEGWRLKVFNRRL
jgi:hypothetical protein